MKVECAVLLTIVFWFSGTQSRADTLVLKNGDHLTGTVTDSDGKQVTLKTDYAGDVKVSGRR